MHTTCVVDDTGKNWFIFHNGDWSGEAEIRPADAKWDETAGTYDGVVKLPGFVLRNACRMSVTQELMGVIETAIDDQYNKWSKNT